MYSKIKRHFPEIVSYFPEYEDQDHYLPQKRFMWDIFSTFNNDLANKFVMHSMKQRTTEEEKEGEKTFVVSQYVLNQLHSANYFSKKKGKAFFMLKASKEYSSISRKRKRQFATYDLDNEEEEKHLPKRRKTSDRDTKITSWLKKINPNERINEEDEEQLNESNNSDEDFMNIDRIATQKKNNPFS